MPYKSKAQEAYMHIHHPEIAKKWDEKYETPHNLPEHVKNNSNMSAEDIAFKLANSIKTITYK